jgi:hypothetical protein
MSSLTWKFSQEGYMRRLRYGVITLAVATGCALNPAPVPVVGDSWGISDLAGEWTGEYRGGYSNRSGTIVFKLAAGRDTAYGDVVMAPRLSFGAHSDDPTYSSRSLERPQTLFIRFVRVEDNRINGVMEPYMLPDCECLVYTAFTGLRRGNRIEGTFVTQDREGYISPERGTWWVVRKEF